MSNPFDDAFSRMFNEMRNQSWYSNEEGEEKEKPDLRMWKVNIFEGDNLILDHSQPGYDRVLKVALNALVEVLNRGVKDYRLIMLDGNGNVYFYAIGEKSQIINLKKKGEKL
jgi:hypothetical protein